MFIERCMDSQVLMNWDYASSSANKLAGKKMGMDGPKSYSQSRCEVGFEDTVKFDGVAYAFEKHDKVRSALNSLRDVTRELFRKGGEVCSIELSRCSSEKEMKCFFLHEETMIECLNENIDNVLSEANDVLKSSAAAIYNSQHDRDIVEELGDSIMQTALRSVFEENIWKHESPFRQNRNGIWLDKLKEVSELFAQLDSIVKALQVGDLAHSQKGASTFLFEEMKTANELSVEVSESYEYQPLSHMSKEELLSYFNSVIASMKRDHEFALQQQMEKYFVLKRKYLKEKGSSERSRKFDAMRKKIAEVTTKLEDFLSRNGSSTAVIISDIEKEEKLKTEIDRLLQENHVLRDHIAGSLDAVEISRERENDDFDFDFSITQGLSNLIILEAIKDAELNLKYLHQKFQEEKQSGMLLEGRSRELENEVRMEVEEKEKLVKETLDLRRIMEEKDKLLIDSSDQVSKLEELATVKHVELESLRAQLTEALEQIDDDEMEVLKLYQKLDRAKESSKQSNREREAAVAQAQETHDSLMLGRARDKERENEMDKIIVSVHGLSKMFDDFECRISEAVRKNHLSLESTSSHLKALTKTSNLSQTGLMYEERLKRMCANLKMAEAEVDLLGDEVEALVRLLEKIYIALYHYSPILKHYPGIVEILELVRRELHGEPPTYGKYA